MLLIFYCQKQISFNKTTFATTIRKIMEFSTIISVRQDQWEHVIRANTIHNPKLWFIALKQRINFPLHLIIVSVCEDGIIPYYCIVMRSINIISY